MSVTLSSIDIAQNPGQNPSAKPLFSGVSFFWQSPSLQVVMGASGGGKSSFLKTIGGVWKPMTGRVLFNQTPLWGQLSYRQDSSILKQIGFAFQNNALFSSLRVIENLSFPYSQIYPLTSHQESQEIAKEWLKKVGLEATAFNFPHELSGGMQKRLSLARTLMLNPKFIFLDDPTAGLDPITSKEMSKLLKDLIVGSSSLIVIVTNDPDRAKDWGPNIHFLYEKELISPDHPNYKLVKEKYL